MELEHDDYTTIRAVREGWAIPPDKLPAVIDRLITIATSTVSAAGDVAKAARALASFARLQLEAIKLGMAVEAHRELVAKIDQLQAIVEGSGAGPGAPLRARPYDRIAPPGWETDLEAGSKDVPDGHDRGIPREA